MSNVFVWIKWRKVVSWENSWENRDIFMVILLWNVWYKCDIKNYILWICFGGKPYSGHPCDWPKVAWVHFLRNELSTSAYICIFPQENAWALAYTVSYKYAVFNSCLIECYRYPLQKSTYQNPGKMPPQRKTSCGSPRHYSDEMPWQERWSWTSCMLISCGGTLPNQF